MKAIVFEQRTPKHLRTLALGGQTYEEYEANLVDIGSVSGTYKECWDAARKLTRFPVLEFDAPFHGGEA